MGQDEQVTVLSRLLAAGIPEPHAPEWLADEGVRIDGEVVTDPKAPAPPPARVVLRSG